MLNKTFYLLLHGGLSFNFNLHKKIAATTTASYYGGVTNIKIFDVNYRANGGNAETATMYGKGSFMNYGLAIRYLFGKKI